MLESIIFLWIAGIVTSVFFISSDILLIWFSVTAPIAKQPSTVVKHDNMNIVYTENVYRENAKVTVEGIITLGLLQSCERVMRVTIRNTDSAGLQSLSTEMCVSQAENHGTAVKIMQLSCVVSLSCSGITLVLMFIHCRIHRQERFHRINLVSRIVTGVAIAITWFTLLVSILDFLVFIQFIVREVLEVSLSRLLPQFAIPFKMTSHWDDVIRPASVKPYLRLSWLSGMLSLISYSSSTILAHLYVRKRAARQVNSSEPCVSLEGAGSSVSSMSEGGEPNVSHCGLAGLGLHHQLRTTPPPSYFDVFDMIMTNEDTGNSSQPEDTAGSVERSQPDFDDGNLRAANTRESKLMTTSQAI